LLRQLQPDRLISVETSRHKEESLRPATRSEASPTRPTKSSPVLRALAVLEELAVAPRTAAEIARRFTVNRSTSLRLLNELTAGGYVTRDAVTLHYRIVPQRFYPLVSNSDDHWDVMTVVNPLLARLQKHSGEATMLGVPAPRSMVYMAYYPSVHPVAVREQIGTVRPLHTSALGKAYLSTLDPALLESELDTLTFQGGTERAPKDRDALREEVDAARERGFAYDVEETFLGVSCVAAPARIGRSVIGSIGITGPSLRMTAEALSRFGAVIVAEIAAVASEAAPSALM
jgi:IclR family KDG regulon transcriptional repressor